MGAGKEGYRVKKSKGEKEGKQSKHRSQKNKEGKKRPTPLRDHESSGDEDDTWTYKEN